MITQLVVSTRQMLYRPQMPCKLDTPPSNVIIMKCSVAWFDLIVFNGIKFIISCNFCSETVFLSLQHGKVNTVFMPH